MAREMVVNCRYVDAERLLRLPVTSFVKVEAPGFLAREVALAQIGATVGKEKYVFGGLSMRNGQDHRGRVGGHGQTPGGKTGRKAQTYVSQIRSVCRPLVGCEWKKRTLSSLFFGSIDKRHVEITLKE
jgi:hypothetical protein